MSKILLIKPRFFSVDFQAINHPIGLMYVGAILKKAGHEPKIHDCALDYRDLHILKRTIEEWKPDFIGISIIITELKQTKIIMQTIRKILPYVPVTFGGPWPSANPEEAIKIFGADFVVLGEGEFVFPQLIDAINRGLSTNALPGTASMLNGHVKINSGRPLTEDELNAMPFPAWELLNQKLYSKMYSLAGVGCRPYMTILTSRGCPYKCIYCYHTMGNAFRKRSANSVLAEIEELRFKYGLKEFEIVDDCFNMDRDRMYAILTGLRDRFHDVKLHFPNGLRADILEPKDMALFKQAGTVSAVFAIETSSPRLQKMINKNLNIGKAILSINAAVKTGIISTGFFMIGFPTETYEEASSTIEFAARSALHRAFFNNSIPFKGTEMEVMANDVLKKKKFFDVHNMNYSSGISISAMSDGELQMIFRRAYRRFYLNPKRIVSLIFLYPRIFNVLHWYVFSLLIRIMPRRFNNTRPIYFINE